MPDDRLESHIDISVSGEHIKTFEALALNYTIMHEDLDVAKAEEAETVLYKSSLGEYRKEQGAASNIISRVSDSTTGQISGHL